MKKMIVMAIAAAMMCGCEKNIDELDMSYGYEVDSNNADQYKRVTFDVNSNEWEVVTTSTMTRGMTADGNSMTDLWLFDYMDGALVRTVHKSQGDVDFDSPSLSMKYGEHTVYFVASRGKTPDVDGTSITWQQPSDTFWKSVQVTVGSSTGNVNVVLDRVVTKFKATINDVVPEGTDKLCITPATWWYGMDYVTGSAIQSQHTERSITVPASYIGTSGELAASIFGLSDDDEWMTDVTITAKDAEGNTLGSVVLNDVPFLRNRTTEASGNLFAGTMAFSVTLNEEWLESVTIEW
jgi:hypothetical protein